MRNESEFQQPGYPAGDVRFSFFCFSPKLMLDCLADCYPFICVVIAVCTLFWLLLVVVVVVLVLVLVLVSYTLMLAPPWVDPMNTLSFRSFFVMNDRQFLLTHEIWWSAC